MAPQNQPAHPKDDNFSRKMFGIPETGSGGEGKADPSDGRAVAVRTSSALWPGSEGGEVFARSQKRYTLVCILTNAQTNGKIFSKKQLKNPSHIA